MPLVHPIRGLCRGRERIWLLAKGGTPGLGREGTGAVVRRRYGGVPTSTDGCRGQRAPRRRATQTTDAAPSVAAVASRAPSTAPRCAVTLFEPSVHCTTAVTFLAWLDWPQGSGVCRHGESPIEVPRSSARSTSTPPSWPTRATPCCPRRRSPARRPRRRPPVTPSAFLAPRSGSGVPGSGARSFADAQPAPAGTSSDGSSSRSASRARRRRFHHHRPAADVTTKPLSAASNGVDVARGPRFTLTRPRA